MKSADSQSGLDLEPAVVWNFFSRIAAVPRPSKKEGLIRRCLLDMAEELGLAARVEDIGNVIIDVPGSEGCENAPITVLQAHMDMVCEKDGDVVHDFERQPIRLILDSDAAGEAIVRADRTTLGADNGMGVALALSAASSPGVVRGPLELVFTVDEESGMTGANALTPKSFRGRRLFNLDSEEDDVIYIGCAGGCDATLTFECGLEDPGDNDVACRVFVSGLRGGHSGADIHEDRGNAIKLLARTLLQAHLETQRIFSIKGGQLRNAIPREAEASLSVSPRTFDALQAAAKAVTQEAIEEFSEPQLSIRVEHLAAKHASKVLSEEQTRRVIAALAALPHGVLGMDQAIKGLVETSNNVATVTSAIVEGRDTMRIVIGALARSSSAARKLSVLRQIAAVGELAGATFTASGDYPGWQPNSESPSLAICSRVYNRLFGENPKVTAIHAGLECGIIGERVGDVDMVSFGPRIEGAHSPEERVYVESVQKSWEYLQAVLAELARGPM